MIKRKIKTIQTKLLLIEYEAINGPESCRWKLSVVRCIKDLLTHIDFDTETVPMESGKKLKELLTSLKGELLTCEEIKITDELLAI